MGYAGDENDEESLGRSPEGEFPSTGSPDHPRRAIPDPLDRLWMHPSELSPLVGMSTATPSRHRPMWTATLVAGAAGAILTLGVLGAVGAIGGSSDQNGDRTQPTSTALFTAPITSAPIVNAAAIAKRVGRSVVAVSVRDDSGTRRGSGVCVRRARGVATTAKEIITTNRLVGSATDVTVTTADGVSHTAIVVGRDRISDLVLLRLSSAIPAAESATLVPSAGDDIWVVGATRPGGNAPWMSKGVLSAIDSLVSVSTGPTTSGLLETAAASNTVSSGGALVDGAGNVTGVVLSPVGDGMTYAVPIKTALAIAHDLRTHGYAKHGALGIDGVDAPAGPTITGIVAEGPAERAGLQVGDIVESVDDRDVDSMDDVMALIRHDSPGEPIAIEIRRGELLLEMKATLATMSAT